MTTFFIGDTHFGHKNILQFEAVARPFTSIEEHDEELVKRWNSKVKPNDRVWHLGDVAWGSKNLATVSRLNGQKRLVLGNHDTYPTLKYLEYFGKVYGVAIVEGFVLTHIPISPCSIERYGRNIHGHLHSKTIDDDRYINVSAERINLTPIALEELGGLQKKTK